MKRFPVAFRRGSAVVLLLVACNEEKPAPSGILPPDYEEHFVEVRDCRFSVEHDAVFIRILADPLAHGTYIDETFPFAEGALVVKQEFHDSACSELIGITLMQRLANGEDPDAGNWAWQELDADAEVLGPEDPRTCASCHLSCTLGRDGVCADP